MKHKMYIKKHYFRFNILNHDTEKLLIELLVGRLSKELGIPERLWNKNVSGDDI